VTTPAAWARAMIAGTLPPSDLDRYQIHIERPCMAAADALELAGHAKAPTMPSARRQSKAAVALLGRLNDKRPSRRRRASTVCGGLAVSRPARRLAASRERYLSAKRPEPLGSGRYSSRLLGAGGADVPTCRHSYPRGFAASASRASCFSVSKKPFD